MKFKVDENLPLSVAPLLRSLGHDACTVVDQGLGGTADEILIPVLQAERRVLVTLDVKIADIRRFPLGTHAGIVLLRPESTRLDDIADLLDRRMRQFLELSLEERLTVVTPTGIRQFSPRAPT